ncbi:hypothetical protein GCM10010517_33280 [Streptosporangium fragile]|uniref:Aminoacyl-transfer RNA synthetases class-II family profile domain-containing protein n=1 Tax=Streptosporangium fragile TaxID=46186 RepID=A0ABN3VXF7_9ACTN
MRGASGGRAGDAPRDSHGARHPVTVMAERIVDVFVGLGYRVVEGPEVEAEWFAFDALNMDERRFARAADRAFYLEDPVAPDRRSGLVLRTCTSPAQIRAMLGGAPPLRVVCTGRAFRPDPADATHSPVFNQVEVLAVDRGLTMADLKNTLDRFAASVLGEGTPTRLRAHRFACTDPSVKVDVACTACHGTATPPDAGAREDDREDASGRAPEDAPAVPCGACGGRGWIEWGGCGMVHPRVLGACGVDPHHYSGFTLGMGIERTLMLRHGLKDIRDVIDGDIRFALALDEFPPRPAPPGSRGTRDGHGGPDGKSGRDDRGGPLGRMVPSARAVPEAEIIPGSRAVPGARRDSPAEAVRETETGTGTGAETGAIVREAEAAPEVPGHTGTEAGSRAGATAGAEAGGGGGGGLDRSRSLRRRIGHALAGAGYVETPGFPFVGDTMWEALGLPPDDPRRTALRLANPLDPRRPALRTTLLPALLSALALNLGRGNRDPALFEQGAVFIPRPGAGSPPSPPAGRRPTDDQLDALDAATPAQPHHLAAALTGEASWACVVEAARTAAHVMGARLATRPVEYAPWRPGRCFELLVEETVLGHAGELHPGTARTLGLPAGTGAMEIDLTAMERLTDRETP